MRIHIAYYPDATSETDVTGTDPKYQHTTFSFEGGIEFIGKLERIAQAEDDKRVLDAAKEDFNF